MVDTLVLNEALRIDIELTTDIDYNRTNIISDERGLFFEGPLDQILDIVKSMVSITEISENNILNKYIMCVNFEDAVISFIIKEE